MGLSAKLKTPSEPPGPKLIVAAVMGSLYPRNPVTWVEIGVSPSQVKNPVNSVPNGMMGTNISPSGGAGPPAVDTLPENSQVIGMAAAATI
jgi:hypothetical protein